MIEEFDFERASEEDRRALYDLSMACHEHDAPAGVEMVSYEGWVASRQLPQLDFGPPRTLVSRDEGHIIGSANVRQSAQAENAHVALYGTSVHPRHRRLGIGKALLRAALPLMDGRTVIEARRVYHGSGGQHFATARGFRTAITWTVQRLTISELPEASEPPTGYELVHWTGAVPDEHLTAYVDGLNAMVDAPSGDMAVDTTHQTVESVRKTGAEFLGAGGDIWVVLALHGDEIAGLTELRRYPGEPDIAFQWDTVVTRAHRGKGLGRLVKAHMMHQLPAEIERIETQTNSTNEHMLRVNHSLGYVDQYTYSTVNAQIADLRL